MTVKDLRERLADFPDWMEIKVASTNGDEGEATAVDQVGGAVLIVGRVDFSDEGEWM